MRGAALAACVGGSLAAAILVTARRRRRHQRPSNEECAESTAATVDEVLDVGSSGFAHRACTLLREQGFARLKLAAADVPLTQALLRDAGVFFDDDAATRSTRVPPPDRKAHDSRSGYMCDRGREFLELHPRAAVVPEPKSTSAAALLRTATAFAAACHEVCEAVLDEFALSSATLAAVTASEAAASVRGSATNGVATAAATAAASTTHGTPPFSASFSASMLRVHRYTEDTEYPPHCDLGLLTLAPRASVPGLVVQPTSSGTWVAIEERMGAEEVPR